MKDLTLQVLKEAAQAIYDKKGENIIAIDVRGLSSITDYFLIAEGNVDRHVQALTQEIKTVLDKNCYPLFHTEGGALGHWVAIDCGDIFIHLMTHEFRDHYSLEEMWKDGKVIDLELKAGIDH